jgi:hypothetical protein
MPTLILMLVLQGVPVPAFQSGSITGVLTTATGKPAIGVRVSALTRPDSALDALVSSAMASISETDQNGVYKLENIPPGRYYIVAGRLDQPTYYPGALEMASGKEVLITPGTAIVGMNFAMKDNSVGRASTFGMLNAATSWTIPLRVTVEGGGKIPIFDNGVFPAIRLTRVSDNQILETPLASSLLTVPLTANPEYRVTIENLSRRYIVKAVASDKINLTSRTLKLPPPPAPVPLNTATGNTFLNALGLPSFILPLPPVQTIEITLAETDAPTRTGATIRGSVAQPLQRSIGISGIPGSIYGDGTFEVRNVPPGRHTILTRENPTGTRPVGAVIIVGDRDIGNIRLEPILEIPRDFDSQVASTMRGTLPPGTVVPLTTVRGHLVEEMTGRGFELDRSIGKITINGNTVSYTINNTGDFEIRNLLPGRYDLELWVYGGTTYTRALEVRDEDMTIEWPVSVPD